MRNIGIIGAGQAGLQLAFGLLAKGYAVTVYSDRTPEQLFNARLAATTYLFGRAYRYEQELGLDFWTGPGEYAQGGDLDICMAPGQRGLRVQGRILNAGKAVDLRAKYSRWLAELERRGGTVVVRDVDVEALEALAPRHEAAARDALPRAQVHPDRGPRRVLLHAVLRPHPRPPALHPAGSHPRAGPGPLPRPHHRRGRDGADEAGHARLLTVGGGPAEGRHHRGRVLLAHRRVHPHGAQARGPAPLGPGRDGAGGRRHAQ